MCATAPELLLLGGTAAWTSWMPARCNAPAPLLLATGLLAGPAFLAAEGRAVDVEVGIL